MVYYLAFWIIYSIKWFIIWYGHIKVQSSLNVCCVFVFLAGIWTRTVGTLQHVFAEYDDAVLTEMMPHTQIWCVDRNGRYHMSIKYSNITANIPRTTFMQHTGDMFQGMHGIVYIIYRFITPKRYVCISESDSIKVTLVALPLTVTVAIWLIVEWLRTNWDTIGDWLVTN